MRIIVDMDEVMCHWVSRIIEWYNQDKRREAAAKSEIWTDVSLKDIKCWDVMTNLGPDSEIYIRSYMRYSGFNLTLDPIDGAVEGVRKLLDLGHDVIVVTTVPKCAGLAYEGKKEWLRNHMPFLSLDNLIAAKRKYLVKADVMFDDGSHNLEAFVKEGGIAVAMERPWNLRWEDSLPGSQQDRAYSVSNWPAFIELIENLGRTTVIS